MPNRAIATLTEILRPEIDLSKSRLETLCLIFIGMVSARSVNLSHIACERPGVLQTASTYRRLQRVFQYVHLDEDWALPLLIRLLGQHGSWLLALDCTNWQIGKTEVNFLVLAIVTRRFRVPLIWTVIDGRSCSDTGQRIALMTRYLAHFPATTIRLLLADHAFAGADWMEFLFENNIAFAIRITTEDGHDLTLRARLHQARRSRVFRARLGSREDAAAGNAPLLTIAAKRLKTDWLIVVTNVEAPTVLRSYRKRWAIECLFGDAKTHGLNLEDTQLTDPRKFGLLMSLTALAIAWAGRAAADQLGNHAPARKSHGYYAKSFFRTGFATASEQTLSTQPNNGRGSRKDSRKPRESCSMSQRLIQNSSSEFIVLRGAL